MSASPIQPSRAFDAAEAESVLGALPDNHWRGALLAAVGTAPYLARLASRRPHVVSRILEAGPEALLQDALAKAHEAGAQPFDAGMSMLREAKAELHFACAIADLACAWPVGKVTDALSEFADVACVAALALSARVLRERGDLASETLTGFIVIAMGKHGACELNYSSDIDLTLFVDPQRFPAAEGKDPRQIALRLVPLFVRALEEVNADGYVFRTDLRLRPDPASTPVVVTVAAAEAYYQSVGQNWERAAFIKARPVAGDIEAGKDFLDSIQPFIWRRHLDYAAIADIHSIKRQILSTHKGGALDETAPDVKLGRGGIRDIELFAQTQQLILGGRDKRLRVRDTIGALGALTVANVVDVSARDNLEEAYNFLRAVEHRIQMLHDEQTHRVPANGDGRARLACLCGYDSAEHFDVALADRRARVARIDAQLFKGEETLADPMGSLIFTGVEDHPETIATLERLGFKNASAVSAAVRGWHHGRFRATRSERARELLTMLMPKLLRAMSESGEPDLAFTRFDDFLKSLPAGVQVFSLMQAQPALLTALADAFGLAPRISQAMARRPALIDAVLDPRFAQSLAEEAPGDRRAVLGERLGGASFEEALNVARRFHREEALRIGLQVLEGRASAQLAGQAYSDLAEACVRALADISLAEVERRNGKQPGAFCVLALGKFGGAEMSEGSDLDMMLVYDAPEGARAGGDGLGPVEFYARLTQRMISALSAPTEEGALYEVDMQLRPSGSKGPVAVRLSSFERYYAEEAWTWELQALTRARVVAGDDALGQRLAAAAHAVLASSRDRAKTLHDVADMRARMDRERSAHGLWDLKLAPGGMVDVEFAAQALMLISNVVEANTGAALEVLEKAGALEKADSEALLAAWRLYADLTQVLKICIDGPFAPEAASNRLRALLAITGGVADFEALEALLRDTQTRVRAIFSRVVA